MSEPGNGQVVVLGGSMGGMLAARVLADRYERVIVVERDQLTADARHRRGVPQSHHFHTVHRRGTEVLGSLFPGIVDELVAEGAHRTNLLRDARVILSGHELCRVDTGDTVQLTRPLLERQVRDRLADLPNVKIVDNCVASDPHTTGDRVTGVRVVHRAGRARSELLEADLVVDAMGRAGRAATWLPTLGHVAPPVERIKADLAYASRLLRIPDAVAPPDRMVLVGPVPGRPRGFVLGAQEGGRWMLTIVGMAGDHPPRDDEALLEFFATAAPPDVLEAIRAAEPAGETHTHRYPASVWRHYERLRRFPVGLLAFGDSICGFNPIYGQGMTVAALQADALRQCLSTGHHDLARRFFRAAARVIRPVWQLNAGGDLALPEVEGHRSLAVRVVNRYVARLQGVAEYDPAVSAAFMRVAALQTGPSALMRPAILARTLSPRR